jgi:hypothetical protein
LDHFRVRDQPQRTAGQLALADCTGGSSQAQVLGLAHLTQSQSLQRAFVGVETNMLCWRLGGHPMKFLQVECRRFRSVSGMPF